MNPQLNYYSKLNYIKEFFEDINEYSGSSGKSKSHSSNISDDIGLLRSGRSNKKAEGIPNVEKPNNSHETIESITKCNSIKSEEIEIDCGFWNVEGKTFKNVLIEKFLINSELDNIDDKKNYVIIAETCLNLKTQWRKKLSQLSKLSALIMNLRVLHPDEDFILLLICNKSYSCFQDGLKSMEQNLNNFKKYVFQDLIFIPIFFDFEKLYTPKSEEIEKKIQELTIDNKNYQNKILSLEERIESLCIIVKNLEEISKKSN